MKIKELRLLSIEQLLKFMSIAEKLKCTTRHSWTSSNRQESVAEHSWRLCLLAYLLKNELKDYDIDKVILMCLIHDLGEAITGDIPTFNKSNKDEEIEKEAVNKVIEVLDRELGEELKNIFTEIHEEKTKESKLFKALDKLEVVMQHNEAPIETWIELEYKLNLVYGEKEAEEIPFLKEFRRELKSVSEEKILKNK